MNHDHSASVEVIAARIKHFHALQKPFRIYHGATNSTRHSQYTRDNTVDTSKLCHVLLVDVNKRIALVEPNVAMDALVEATMSHGLIPPVVMEFPGITAGGGFAGTAGESSSFRHGFFDQTVDSIEMVLPNGEVVSASENERRDLFIGAASSFGTLGITTLMAVRLVDASTHVLLTYQPVNNVSEAVSTIEKLTLQPSIAYIDGMMYSSSRGVICSGYLSNEIPHGVKVQRFTRRTDPWFYLHVEQVTKHGSTITEAVPLVDYMFRYDRGSFWVARYAFNYFITPFNRVTRFLLDRFIHTRVMYHALHKSGLSDYYIVQDVAIPYSKASEFVDYLEHDFGHYPLWICPLLETNANESPMSPRSSNKAQARRKEDGTGMMLNFGVWGPGPRGQSAFVAANRRLEQKVDDLGGKKWLYAHAYYTEDEFWRLYDRRAYDALRKKYHAEYLPSIFDKVVVNVSAPAIPQNEPMRAKVKRWTWSIWPIGGLYGVYHASLRKDYLMGGISTVKTGMKTQ